ncbi:MAG: PKD domain-containing protein, partial [Deltaproteobacteria bacterium]|nr:PKD domain-containing protein [Deltaproteobacteria bacterium]
AVSPTFTAPAVDAAGDTLTFELTVEDNEGLQDTDTCVVNVSNVNILPMSGLFDSSGGESSISVSVGAGFAWTAVSNDEWITITSDSSGVGDGTVSYSVDATTSSSGRMGTLTIAGETFIVDQIGVNGASWSDNFNGGPQQSWIVVNTGTNSTATPTSNRYELHTEGSDYTKWIGAAANVSADDCTIQAKVQKILPGDCFHPTMSLRISRSALNFYTFGVVDNGPGLGITIGIRKRVGGVYTLLAAVPNISGLNMSSPFYMKFSALGNQLSGKVWNVGDPEPAEWMVEVEDNDIPSGGGGIGMAANYNCFVSQGAFDDVVFTAPNIPPVADAGPDQLVDEEVLVTLDGSGSTDSDGTIASYLWTKMAGPAVTLSDPTAMNPTFTSPSVGAGGASLTFQLTVTDNGELQNTDTCVVNVSKVNVPPVADAGPNQTVDEEVVVTLNGSGSTDPDGTIASWQWTQTGGPAVTLSDSSAMSPTFTSPTVGVEGEALTFELTVTDDGELQDTDTCIVNVSYVNLPPIANAGPDQTVDQEVEVTIDGSASHDDDGTIVSYHWEQTGGPSVFLSDPASVTPVFTTPLYEEGANILTFILTVTDDGGLLGEDTCTITVIHNNPPEPPLLTGPEDGAIFVIGDAITLTAGAYDDPEDDAHVESQWCIRRTDRPTYDYKFTSSTDLTQYSATGLLPGLQYAWKVGYKDAGSGLFTWSEEWTFSVGPPIVDTSVSVPTGFNFEDYLMVSFTVWPDDPAATSVFGITPDTTELRIAGYDPTLGGTGGYREYGNPDLFINPGSSYWFLVRGGITPAIEGIAVSLDVDIDIPLLYNPAAANGWNMIASPNSADYKWEDVQVLEYDAGGTIIQGPTHIGDLSYENTMIDKRLWRWESGTYYSDTAELEKNAGYWLKARKSNVWLRFPADAHLASANITKVYVKRMMKEATKLAKAWGLTPSLAIAEVSDTPPMPPGEFTGGGSHFSAKEGGGCFITTTKAH